MKTIIHKLNDGSGTNILVTITKKTVRYKAAFGESVEGAWTVPTTKGFAVQTLRANRNTLRSSVR